jgi:DNA repair protein RecO (recombination protein O)
MPGSLRTDAIVLRRTNYGEADRILQVITPENGKLSVMARGVRREKSRLSGGIELFAVCDIVLHLGKGEIATLTGARLRQFFENILTDYDRLQTGYEMIKQTAKAAETIDEPEFYSLLKNSLVALNNPQLNIKIAQAWFYLRLAGLLGNELNTATDSQGMKLVEGANYNFDINDQAFAFSDRGQYNSEHIKILRLMAHNPPEIIVKINQIEQYIDDCLRLAQIVAKI